MAQYWMYLIFTTIFILLNSVLGFQCPDGCECSTPKHLLCSNKNLISIPTSSSMYEITVFNISSNRIQTLNEKVFFKNNMVNEEVIDLSNNSISSIDPNAFYGMNNLKELYLQNNKLKSILPETFSPLTQLIILDLRNNSIKELNNRTFESMTLLKQLSLSGLREFNKDIFNPLKNLTYLQIQFVTTDRNNCQELYSKAIDWGEKNNVKIYRTCEEDPEVHSRKYPIGVVVSHSHSLTDGRLIMGTMITVGVLLLFIISLAILAVIVRQTERMPEELDDYSYMNDFEPYRGNLSPTNCKEFYFSTSCHNIPKSMQETSITPEEDLVSNSIPDIVKADLPQNNKASFKNYS